MVRGEWERATLIINEDLHEILCLWACNDVSKVNFKEDTEIDSPMIEENPSFHISAMPKNTSYEVDNTCAAPVNNSMTM